MPDETTDPCRVAAEAYALSKARLWGLDEASDYDVTTAMLNDHLRAAVYAVRPAFEAAGREAAADRLQAAMMTLPEGPMRESVRWALEIVRGGDRG